MRDRAEDFRSEGRPVFREWLHKAAPGFSILTECGLGVGQIAFEHDGRSIVERMGERRRAVDPVQSVICERKRAEKGRAHSKRVNGGAEIVKYLKTGSAYYAPSAAFTEMVEAILKDKKKILPCAVYLEGEYGIKGLFVGVPAKIGSNGVEKIIEIKLTSDEQAALQRSAGAVQELVAVIGV